MSDGTTIENPQFIEPEEEQPKAGRKIDPNFRRHVLVIVGAVVVVMLIVVLFLFLRSSMGDKKAAAVNIDVRQGTVRNAGQELTPAQHDDLVKKQLAEQARAIEKGDTVSIPKDTLAPTVSLLPSRRASEPDFSQQPIDMRAQPGFGQAPGVQPLPASNQAATINPRDEIRRKGMEAQVEALLKADGGGGDAPQRVVFENKQAQGQGVVAANTNATAGAGAASSANGKGPKIVEGLEIAPAETASPIDTYRTKYASATIVAGKLAGAFLVGKSELVDEGLSTTYTMMRFNGKTYPVDAIALDEKTSTDAMNADIDHRYLQRYVMPIIGAAIGGAAQAFAQTGTSVVATSGGVVAATPSATVRQAESAGLSSGLAIGNSALQKEAARPLQATLPAQTPIGILFRSPVDASAAK